MLKGSYQFSLCKLSKTAHLFFPCVKESDEVKLSSHFTIYTPFVARELNEQSHVCKIKTMSSLIVIKVKFMFSKKSTKNDEVFTVSLTFT